MQRLSQCANRHSVFQCQLQRTISSLALVTHEAHLEGAEEKHADTSTKLLLRIIQSKRTQPLGHLNKTEWQRVYGERLQRACGWPEQVTWDRNYAVNRRLGGHMQFLPYTPDDCNPRDHTCDRILFCGVEYPIISDTTIRGNYILDGNWRHWESSIVDLPCPWMRIPM